MTSTQLTLPPESPFGRLFLPTVALSLGGLYFLTRTSVSPFLLTAAAGILGLGYLPGLAASVWMERRFGLWSSWILPLMLSPVLVTAAALTMAWFGVPLAQAPSWIVLAATAVILFAPQPQREIEDWAVSLDMPSLIRSRSDRQQVILLATVVLGLIAVPLLVDRWILGVGEAAYHAAVARSVFQHMPPLDPLLAGFPLRDFWAWHVWIGLLQESTGADARMLLAGGSLIAAFTLVFAAYRFLTLLGIGHARALWGTIFVFFSLGGLFWLGDPIAAALSGQVWDGWGGLWRRFAVLPEATGLHHGFPQGTTFFLQTFLVPAPIAFALVYMVLFVTATIGMLGEGLVRRGAVAFLAVVGLALFHPGVGGITAIATVLTVPTLLAVGALNPFRRPGAETFFWLVPLGLAAVVALPYLRTIAVQGGIDPRSFFDIGWRRSGFLLVAVLPEFLFGIVAVFAFLAASDVRRQAWAVWSMLILALFQFVNFGTVRSLEGPVLILHTVLAMSAGALVPVLWGRLAGVGRSFLVVLLVLILVPRSALGVAAWLRAPDPRDERIETRDVASWLHRNTPSDAVIVDYRPDLALSVGRRLLVGDRDHMVGRGYHGNPVTVRNLAFFAMLRGTDIQRPEEKALLEVDAPIFVVQRRPEGDKFPPPPHSTRVYENDGYTVYRWDPSVLGAEEPSFRELPPSAADSTGASAAGDAPADSLPAPGGEASPRAPSLAVPADSLSAPR